MKCFKSVLDAGDLNALVQEILEIKKNPHTQQNNTKKQIKTKPWKNLKKLQLPSIADKVKKNFRP